MTDHSLIAKELFMQGYNCAQAVMCAFSDVTGYDMAASARISSSFGGGLGRLRETCGVVSAAALVLGIVKGYDDPADREAKKRHYELVFPNTIKNLLFQCFIIFACNGDGSRILVTDKLPVISPNTVQIPTSSTLYLLISHSSSIFISKVTKFIPIRQIL